MHILKDCYEIPMLFAEALFPFLSHSGMQTPNTIPPINNATIKPFTQAEAPEQEQQQLNPEAPYLKTFGC